MIDHRGELWCAWFVGFVDGEGSFQIQKTGNENQQLMPHLQIILRGDDSDLVHEIQEILGVGRIYSVSKRADRKRGRDAADQVMWRCRELGDIVRVLIPLFDTYQLRSKKRFEYPVWREACLVKHRYGNCGEMVGLKKRLMDIRKMSPEKRLAESEVRDSWRDQPRLL